jgi:hypothetical protein
MITKLLALIFSLALASACVPAGMAQSVAGVDGIENSLNATVVLYNLKGRLVCAGERVSATEVLTAFHCVVAAALTDAEADEIEESDPEYESLRFERVEGRAIELATYSAVMAAGRDGTPRKVTSIVHRADMANDIAILRTKASGQAVVRVSGTELSVGEPVYAIGHPYGLEFSFSRGYVSNPCRWLSGPKCLTQVDISIWGGSSGGGLYDRHGQLVGVASRRVNATYGFFTPPAPIAALVAALVHRR